MPSSTKGGSSSTGSCWSAGLAEQCDQLIALLESMQLYCRQAFLMFSGLSRMLTNEVLISFHNIQRGALPIIIDQFFKHTNIEKIIRQNDATKSNVKRIPVANTLKE